MSLSGAGSFGPEPGNDPATFLSGRFLRDLLFVAIFAAVLALFVRTFLVLPIRIPTESMADTLLPGDRVLTDRSIFGFPGAYPSARSPLASRKPRRGDVLTFLLPGPHPRLMVKRCIGLPGETVAIDPSGHIRIDGETLPEPYLRNFPESGVGRAVSEPLRIELAGDEYFVLGDHRAASKDSRHWGPIKSTWIRGRVLLIYWSSLPPTSSANKIEGWGKMVEHSKGRLMAIRWERALEPVR